MFERLPSFSKKNKAPLLKSDPSLELHNHFTVQTVLGRGSYATVYQVRRHHDGLQYALKHHPDLAQLYKSEWSAILNESRLLASLNHPGITRFYEAFEDRGQLFVVMEHMPGGDLAATLRKRAETDCPLSEDEVWGAFLQLLLAVRYLHSRRVLHGDLKPGNVLLSDGGRTLKVADLGISQILDAVFSRAKGGTS